MDSNLTFYEFFAGGGLARLGLGPDWQCLFANDISAKKGTAYTDNFEDSEQLLVADIATLSSDDLPGRATLAWASFPCQDLSLAGNGQGIEAERSGTFWSFWKIIEQLKADQRTVPLVVIENVVGLLSSSKGKDFQLLTQALSRSGYNIGAVVINAERFVPQSRPRLFIVAVDQTIKIPRQLTQISAEGIWFPKALQSAHANLSPEIKESWVWWQLPVPDNPPLTLSNILEDNPEGIDWHSPEETQKLLSMMNDHNINKVRIAQSIGVRQVGAVYKRTRKENGKSVQRAEVRFDGKSGCLRTPAGGSSRQTLLIVEGDSIRSRLVSPRETARLMGLDDAYRLPTNYNEAYHLMGDAVVVPVISWLEQHLLRPMIDSQHRKSEDSVPWPIHQLSLVDF